MKGTVITLGQLHGRLAAARVVDGQLEDLLIDPPESFLQPGAIYRGTVDRGMKGQGGVFVNLADGQKGFLRQAKGLSPGQPLLVQVSGFAEAGKAAPVTTKILCKSRFAIVTPGAPGLNVSRQIRDDDLRDELLAIAHDQMEGAPEGLGLILRSCCATAQPDEVAEDIAAMRDLAEMLAKDQDGSPELLMEGYDAHTLAWREWDVPDQLATEDGAFEDHGVLDAIDALFGAQPLKDGGSIFVEATRAMVTVDVNTGRDTSPAAGVKANMAAARALPRQLRLRGLGGIVTIDFAPMPKKDRRQLEQTLRAAFRADSIDTTLAGWTPLGNYELQRKRERLPLKPVS